MTSDLSLAASIILKSDLAWPQNMSLSLKGQVEIGAASAIESFHARNLLREPYGEFQWVKFNNQHLKKYTSNSFQIKFESPFSVEIVWLFFSATVLILNVGRVLFHLPYFLE